MKQHMALYSLRRTDYKEIIQVSDMDGAFVPDSAIVEDKNAYKPVYSEKEIHTNHPEGIMKRNAQKRENMNRLITTNTIGKIPYHIYYMSSNLDHVLYNKLNSTDDEKENDTHNFAEKYEDDLIGFKSFIRESDFSVNKDFIDSWDYIKQKKTFLRKTYKLWSLFGKRRKHTRRKTIIKSFDTYFIAERTIFFFIGNKVLFESKMDNEN